MASSTLKIASDPVESRTDCRAWSLPSEAVGPIGALVRKLDGYAMLGDEDRKALAGLARCLVPAFGGAGLI